MAHIRLDDKRIELSSFRRCAPLLRPWIGNVPQSAGTAQESLRRHRCSQRSRSCVAEESVHRLRAPVAHNGHRKHGDDDVVDQRLCGPRAGIWSRESDWFVADMDSTNETRLSGDRIPSVQALNLGTAVRFRGAKVIFRSEPEIVDADGETVLLVIQDC